MVQPHEVGACGLFGMVLHAVPPERSAAAARRHCRRHRQRCSAALSGLPLPTLPCPRR
jgi:hypothetical protein